MGLFQSFFNKPDSAAMHSNDMAKIADGDQPSFGATSAQSFRQRMRIERNRRHVGSYRQANMHHEYRSDARENSATQPSHQNTPAPSAHPAPRFQEPSARKYNPYQ
jgi:hypothetical protein